MQYASIIAAAVVYIKSRRDSFPSCRRKLPFRFFICAASFAYSQKPSIRHISISKTIAYDLYLLYCPPSQALIFAGTWRRTIITTPFENTSPNSSLLERCPLLLTLGAGQHGLYKTHTTDAIIHVRKVQH